MIYLNYTQFYKLRLPEGHDYYDVEDFNSNTMIVDGELNKLKNMIGQGGGGSASEQIITLPAANWDGNGQQTVNVQGAKDNSVILLGIPTGISQTEYNYLIGASIVVASTSGSSIVLQAYGSVPSTDIHVSIVVM